MTGPTKSRSIRRSPPVVEGWLSIIGLATAAYYLVTFAFEIGFFWNRGLEYTIAFSIGDHTMHAAAFIIGTAGASMFVYLTDPGRHFVTRSTRTKPSPA